MRHVGTCILHSRSVHHSTCWRCKRYWLVHLRCRGEALPLWRQSSMTAWRQAWRRWRHRWVSARDANLWLALRHFLLPDFVSAIRRYWRISKNISLRGLNWRRLSNAIFNVWCVCTHISIHSFLVSQENATIALTHLAKVWCIRRRWSCDPWRYAAILRAKNWFDNLHVSIHLLSVYALNEVWIEQVYWLLVHKIFLLLLTTGSSRC